MEKLVYLLWAARSADPDRIKKQLLEDCAPRLLALGARALSMCIDDSDAAVPSPVPWPADELPLVATVSLWIDCYDRRAPFEQVLCEVGDKRAGYLVCESLYTDYGDNPHAAPRDWPDGQRSPGVLTVSLLEKPARLSYERWIELWHGTQSPVSAEIQPRTRYVRNTVVRALSKDAPPYLGIVEEAWPSAEHVRDPMLFYLADGSPERLKRNIARMMESVTAFLEIERIRNVTMSEYLIAGPGRGRPRPPALRSA